MTHNEIVIELAPLFREVFDDDTLTPTAGMTAKDVDNWDSLAHIRLIIAVENHFSIRFTSAEVMNFADVGEFVTSIHAKLDESKNDAAR